MGTSLEGMMVLQGDSHEQTQAREEGPMLRHGLQGFQGVEVATPRAVALKPRAEFLAERYELFRRAS